MENGRLQSTKSKTRHRLKRVLISLMKGGDKMLEARKICVEAMRNLNDGKMPNTPAEITSKLGYAAAMNQFAETAMIREIGQADIVGELVDSHKKVMDM